MATERLRRQATPSLESLGFSKTTRGVSSRLSALLARDGVVEVGVRPGGMIWARGSQGESRAVRGRLEPLRVRLFLEELGARAGGPPVHASFGQASLRGVIFRKGVSAEGLLVVRRGAGAGD